LLVHIGDPQKNQADSLESQTIPTIQYVLGQALIIPTGNDDDSIEPDPLREPRFPRREGAFRAEG
jgi:hypothetical protein